jgi:predicted small secreted protein
LNARNVLLAALAISTATLTSCGSLRRAGKDVFVGITSPALIVYGGATDGYTSAMTVREGLDSGSAVEVLAFPFTFAYHAVEHFLYCGIHVLDLPLTPFYAMSELPPGNNDVQPLDFYQGTWFDETPSGTDATTGEVPPGYNR